MNLFEDIQSEKDQSEIEPIDNQVVTMYLFLSMTEKAELNALMKEALPSLVNKKHERNMSDGILNLLRHYVNEQRSHSTGGNE